MKLWRPKDAGLYLIKDMLAPVCTVDGELRWQTGTVTPGDPVPDDVVMSRLLPDWQDGPPTVEQLKRWQWWAISDDTRTVAGRVLSASPVGYNLNGHIMLSVSGVRKSAPVQPVPGEILWVPLEVVNEL